MQPFCATLEAMRKSNVSRFRRQPGRMVWRELRYWLLRLTGIGVVIVLIAAAAYLTNDGGGSRSGGRSLFGDDPYFRRCADAAAAGYGRMREGEPGYAHHLDADGDGVACEWN